MGFRNAVIAALALVATCVGSVRQSHADEMDDILKRGELRVAVQTQGPPVSFVDKNGQRTGLAIELSQMMATDLSVKLVIQDYDWKGLIPALLSGKVDMIAADLTPTPQRAAQLLFSRPMFFQDTVAVAGKDTPYKTWQDLDKDGLNIGATQSSTFVSAIKKFMPKATAKEYPSTGDTIQALSNGRVDAAVSDLGNVTNFVREYGTLKILDGVITREPLAFAVRANAFHLKMWLDNYVELTTADRRLQTAVSYWWTSTDWEKDHK
jgi:polar amino acid transport system substrate-binding protein